MQIEFLQIPLNMHAPAQIHVYTACLMLPRMAAVDAPQLDKLSKLTMADSQATES